jgi:hypothetical protein
MSDSQKDNRRAQLLALADKLQRITVALEMQPEGHGVQEWIKVFRSYVAECDKLLQDDFTQEQLNELSASIMRLSDGKSGFDYYPVAYNRETGKYERLSEEKVRALNDAMTGLYDKAFALRTVGEL